MSSCCIDSACDCSCTCGKYTFKNLTGSVIRIYDPKLMESFDANYAYLDIGFDVNIFNKVATLIIKPETSTTFYDKNVSMTSRLEGEEGCCASFTTYMYRYQGLSVLPEPEENVLLIVPEMVLKSYPYRTDLVTPYKPVVCASDNTGAVIGYCGFYKNYDGTDPVDKADTTIILTAPSQVVAVAGNIIKLKLSFSESIPSEEENNYAIEVSYTPTNVTCYDKSGDTNIITVSGESRTVAGTLAELNEMFDHFYVGVTEADGKIDLVYANKPSTIEIQPLVVTWDSIADKPNVVTYDSSDEDGDAKGIEISDGTNLIDLIEIELPEV